MEYEEHFICISLSRSLQYDQYQPMTRTASTETDRIPRDRVDMLRLYASADRSNDRYSEGNQVDGIGLLVCQGHLLELSTVS